MHLFCQLSSFCSFSNVSTSSPQPARSLTRRFLGSRGRGYGGGYRRRGGYGGYRRGGYGRHRYGRDLTAVTEAETSVEGLQMDAYFAAVQLGDDDGCGLRLVCELHTMNPAQLGEEENMILALFG